MKLFSKFLLLLLIVLPSIITIFESNAALLVRAEDQVEEDDINVDEEDAVVETGGGEEEETSEDDAAKTQGSPDIDVTLLFTEPEGNGMELPAGKPVEFLIGITNNGDREYIIDSADVSFRYPMDFTYTIKNFSAIEYNKAIKPQQEATVFHYFYPSETYAGRPLGLVISLAYHAETEDFVESVFNATVNIIEIDEGLDGETFFLYVFMLAFAVLLLLAGHYALTSLGVGGSKKGAAKTKQQQSQSQVEVGTTNKNGVDFDWLPDQMKAELKKQAAAATNGSAGGKKGAASSSAAARAAATRTSPRLRSRN